jgi:hypothetical protein
MAQKALFAVTLLVLGLGAGSLAAQDKVMTVVGPVEKIGGDLLVVSSGGKNMQFITTAKTTVKVAAGGAKQVEARREGKEGLKITEVVSVGDQVQVRYTESGGKLMAVEVDVKERRPARAQPQK